MNKKCSRKNQSENDKPYDYLQTTISDNSDHQADTNGDIRNISTVFDIKESSLVEFDPYEYGNQKNPTSFWGVVVHLFIVAASPTLMNIPATFEDVGYVIGFFGSLVTVTFYATCMHSIIAIEYLLCKKLQKSTLSYAELIYYSFTIGPKRFRWLANTAKMIAYVNFLCVWAGGNSVYVLMVSENVKFIYDSFYSTNVSLREVMIYVSIPLVLLCWIPNLRLLVICSSFANILNTGCIIIILYISMVDFPSLENRIAFGKLSGVPLFLGTALITINGTGIIMPLKNQLKDPRRFSSKFGVLNISYIPVGLLYAFFGLMCYVKYGHAVKDNVVLNTPDIYVHFGKFIIIMYTLGIILFYPLVSYVSFDIIWNDGLRDKIGKNNKFIYILSNYLCKTITAMSSIVLAYLVPDISLFVSVTGTVGTSLDSIIFPAVSEILVRNADEASRQKHWMLAKNTTFIVLGVILCIAGLWDSVLKVIN